jgi:hypothetical protein
MESLPVMLGIKIAETENISTVLRDMLLPVLSSTKKMSAQEQDDIVLIKQLLGKKKMSHNGGWSLVTDLVLPCLNVERDELIAENSKIYATFQKDQIVTVYFKAVIYVREKMLIGLVNVDGQEVEEKVPVVILAKNSWFKRH